MLGQRVVPGSTARPATEVHCPVDLSDHSGLGVDRAPREGQSYPHLGLCKQKPVTSCWTALGKLHHFSEPHFICKMGLIIVPRLWEAWVLGRVWHMINT